MSRPKRYQEERVSTAVRLPRDLHDRLKGCAEDRDVSANWLLTRALSTFLDSLQEDAAPIVCHQCDLPIVPVMVEDEVTGWVHANGKTYRHRCHPPTPRT